MHTSLQFFRVTIVILFLLTTTHIASSLPQETPQGMDFLIISTSTKKQKEYWERQLTSLRGKLIKPDAYLLVIQEQWNGGAGNGFGTLLAYQEAMKQAQELYQINLLEFQKQGHSVAIYHTSGQGKRMSPLTASEGNNKSAVKLPTGIPFFPEHTISVLEAVIWQSAQIASARAGRLSVFWGDQIFLQETPLIDPSPYEIDIFAKSRPMPNGKQWQADGLEKYGFFTSNPQGDSCYLEKATFKIIEELINNEKISQNGLVGISLGSFSLSTEMIIALIEEFSPELENKNEMMNVEHSLWMSLTLDIDLYITLMKTNGWSKEQALKQHERLSNFKERYRLKHPDCKLLGTTDIGQNSYWWDYGTIDNYFDALLKLTQDNLESKAMRDFYQIPRQASKVDSDNLSIDATSVVLGCSILKGSIRSSILIGVTGNEVHFDNSVSLCSKFNTVHAINSLYYNVNEESTLNASPKSIRADVALKNCDENIKISTQLGRDGKADWDKRIEDNPYSYAELEKLNQS